MTDYECPICGEKLIVKRSLIGYEYAVCKGINGCGMKTGKNKVWFFDIEDILENSNFQRTKKSLKDCNRYLENARNDYRIAEKQMYYWCKRALKLERDI